MARLASTSDSESRRVEHRSFKMIYYIYVLKSQSANKSYVGMTNNLRRRLDEHNSGKHFYTKRHMPWTMIYNERYDNLVEARIREKYLKTVSGRRFLKKLFAR